MAPDQVACQSVAASQEAPLTEWPVGVHFDGRIFSMQSHGGISRVFRNLFRELARDKSLALNLHLDKEVEVTDLPPSMEIKTLPHERKLRPGRWLGGVSRAINADRLRRHYSILGQGVFHSTFYSTCPAPQLRQVLTLHDMIFEDYPELFADERHHKSHIEEKRKCIERADVIVNASYATRDRLQHHYSALIQGKPTYVIHNGCDSKKMNYAQSPGDTGHQVSGRPLLLHVGSRYSHKNFSRLLAAMTLPELSGFDLLSVGGGGLNERELELIQSYGMGKRVHVVASASEEELAHAYRTAQVVVVPSICEGFGLPLLEAMSFGCPVASSNGGSLPEVGGDVPVYFDPLDVEHMAHAIMQAMTSEQREKSRRQGIGRAQEFSWRKCAAAYAQVYREIAD